ncbi:LytR C-terminal domain-containing protein [Streptomyces pratensis]|uniref:LytR C-terminal domain-containing protein n=1 Tax=Streptomyces pratensis TaxID=1169025 RepID=UPI003018FCB5
MGGKYRITGDAYPRMRRPRNRRRLVFAGVCAVMALGLAGWGTLQLIDVFTGGDKSAGAAEHQPACPTPKPPAPVKALPKPADVKVNVYNATTRSGLAKAAADELEKRGFAVGEVGNASEEYDKKVPGTAVLLGSPTAVDSGFTVLGTQLAGTVRKTDARKTGEVDLILGAKFTAFSTPQEATAAMAALTKPSPAPAPSGC